MFARRVPNLVRLLILGLALILASGALAGCKPKPPPNRLIAFLLASDQSSRWMDSDEPAFQKRVNQTCKGCSYLTLNASGDPDLQSEQFDQALSQGADVIVLNAVDSERAEDLIVAAGKVPVIAYDRFVAGADYYVSYDAQVTGELQAEAVLADAGGAAPSVLLIDGGRLDANTRSIKDARAATFGKKVQVLAELEPATWSAEEAAAWIKTQLGKHRPTTVDAIVAANDTQAGAVVDVLTSMGVKPRQFPYITGQDASLEAVRRIVRGEQAMTVYKPIITEANQAADLAVALVTSTAVTDSKDFEGVASFIFTPQSVTVNNLADTVVRDRLYTLEQICDATTMPACERLGLR